MRKIVLGDFAEEKVNLFGRTHPQHIEVATSVIHQHTAVLLEIQVQKTCSLVFVLGNSEVPLLPTLADPAYVSILPRLLMPVSLRKDAH
jgi:hypothetical protein